MSEKLNNGAEKSVKVKQWLIALEDYGCLLYELLITKEITFDEYHEMTNQAQKSYMEFLKNLHKKPIEEKDVLLPNDDNEGCN